MSLPLCSPAPARVPPRLADALVHYARPASVLEVTDGSPRARAACERLGVPYAAVATLDFEASPPGKPDLILLSAPRVRPLAWSPMLDPSWPLTTAWLLCPPGGVVAVWVPSDGKPGMQALGLVLGALPRECVEAIWTVPHHPEEREEDGERRPVPTSHLVIFRCDPLVRCEA